MINSRKNKLGLVAGDHSDLARTLALG